MVALNVLIDAALNAALVRKAKERGLSKSDIVREGLRMVFQTEATKTKWRRK